MSLLDEILESFRRIEEYKAKRCEDAQRIVQNRPGIPLNEVGCGMSAQIPGDSSPAATYMLDAVIEKYPDAFIADGDDGDEYVVTYRGGVAYPVRWLREEDNECTDQ